MELKKIILREPWAPNGIEGTLIRYPTRCKFIFRTGRKYNDTINIYIIDATKLIDISQNGALDFAIPLKGIKKISRYYRSQNIRMNFVYNSYSSLVPLFN